MSIAEYITNLRNNNIIVTVREEQLAVHDPNEVLTHEIVEELKANKQEIIAFFKSLKRKESSTTIAKTPKKEYYALSSVQKRMYFLYEFDKNGVSYNMPGFYRLGRSLDIAKFDNAIKSLVARHQSLRTVFSIQNDHPMQRVLDAAAFEIEYKQIHPKDIDALVSTFVRPFNLAQEFPYRVTLVDVIGEDYLLMTDSHHIINDGVSNDILMHDLWSLYDGNTLPALDIQYTDYAEWQQSDAYQDVVSRHRKYWLESYNDDLTTLELPLDHSRPMHPSDEGEVHIVTLSKTQSDQLRALAGSEGITMYTLFLSIFNVLLSKLSDQADIVVGTPTAGRHHADVEGVVGMFVNTLALRNQVASNLSFKDFLANVQENTLTAFDHQLYPYDELVDALDFSRDAGRNPLFDVFFAYMQAGTDTNGSTDTGITIKNHEVPYTIAKFDLEFEVLDKEEINLCFVYRKDLFAASSIARFSGYLLQIITEITQNKAVSIKEIDILSKEEKNRLLIDFNNTNAAYHIDTTVLDMFKMRVQETPNSQALILDEVALTYKELDTRSDVWAHHIIDNIGKGEIVGLLMSRSLDMITGILAILKAGGAYLPINTEQPTARTLDMLEECEVAFIVSNVENIAANFLEAYTCITPKTLDEKKSNSNKTLPTLNGEDLAYIIYTSGSTGRPKGVMVKHQGVSNLLQHEIELFRMQQDENVLLFSPYYFDASVLQIWLALTTGARLVIFKDEDILDIHRFNASLKKYNITHLDCTPSFLEAIELGETLHIKRIIVGGEACKLALAGKLSKLYNLYNEYGPTETTVTSTFKKIEQADIETGKISIGRPIANTQAYVLGKNMTLLPEGVVGELYIGGLGVTNGYINNEVLTKERFVENPFGDGKIYKTGDLVKWLKDGTLEYLGRNDNQVKIRGHRIELGEIEAELELISEVNQALVMAHGGKESKQLVAYLCVNEEKDTEEIHALLSDKLPAYMLPAHYVKLDSFPVNANGKTDRKALPIPDFVNAETYVAPQNEDHKKLVAIWSEVLDIAAEKISITSDFFKLGGHSLLAITLINKISKVYQVDIAIRDFFVHRSIAELSLHIATMEQVTFLTIPKAVDSEYYPLSSAQQRMYFLYEFDKEGTVYNMPSFFTLKGTLDVARLETAFQNLVARHQSLRTTFNIVDDVPMQRILAADDFCVNHQKGNSDHIDASIAAFIRPFNLSAEFPFRVSLLEISTEEHLLMMDMHHIINDGVSFEILMRELWMLYQEAPLHDLNVQYVDYAVWQQSDAQQALVANHKNYWMDVFSEEITTLELPTNRSKTRYRSNQGDNHTVRIDKNTSQALKAMAQQEGVTMSTLFLSIYNVLLSKLSNQKDIIVGTVTAGRNHSDLEGIVGMFVNTLALRNTVDATMKFDELLEAVQETTLAAFDHQSFQYEELVDALQISRDAGSNPLFDVFFSYNQGVEASDVPEAPIQITDYKVASNIAKFDLSLDVVASEEITLSFTYRTELFDAALIKRFMSYLLQIITEITQNTAVSINDIDILSKEEKHRLLVDFNDTETAYDLDQTVLDMFIKHAQSTPDATAILFGEEQWTYQELNTRSDQWAGYLLDSGVQSNTIVGLMMTRSVEMIVGIISVMKAGAAYLPINPNQPTARTEYMLEDCEVNIILSNVSSAMENTASYHVINTNILDNAENKHTKLPYVTAADLAYVIYTSGSTGQPKGVLIQHASVSNLIQHEREFLGLESSDHILQFSPYYFDVSVEQIWSAFCTGASLVLVAQETLTDDNEFYAYLETQGVTHLNVTPSFLEKLALPKLTNLKRILVSGEACKLALAKRYAETYDFYNEYGPTEATVISISQKLSAATLKNGIVPIGRPIANTQTYILSDDLQLLPQGVAGELYLGGKGLAHGYLNRQDLTERSFIANPFGDGKIYKTGDQARWLPDGTIEYLGRNDDQVKLRGYRIELGEIAYHLENSDFIDQALVMVSGTGDHQQLVAYVCGNAQVDDANLRSLLAAKVPNYMIPVAFIWIDSFTLNANGKVDKKVLPSLDLTQGETYVAPQNEDHKKLVAIWSEVLDIAAEKISITSDFFKLGGHSLLAITLINKISKVYNVDIAIRDFFVHRSIAELSLHIATMEQVTFLTIPKAVDSEYYPLSSAQQRMYFLYEFDKEGTVYNMPSFFTLKGTLDVARLETAFQNLVRRHQSLRTTFNIVDDVPMQRILATDDFCVNHQKGNSDRIDATIAAFIRPFNLSAEFPFRVSLLEISTEEHLLMMDMHHIINDGVSFEILMRELWMLYQEAPLHDLNVQYVDYAVWQQSDAQQALVANHKNYWMDVFSEEITTLELPTNRSKTRYRSNQGDNHTVRIDKNTSQALKAMAQQEGVTMSTLFLSIYNVLLSKLSNQKDIIVGTVTAGRNHSDLEGIVGMFVNTLALRNTVDATMKFDELLEAVQETTLAAFDHQSFQYEELVDALQISRDAGSNPLFDVFFSYNQGVEASDVPEAPIQITDYKVASNIAKFDLSLDVVASEEITLSFTYRTELFDAALIKRFMSYLVQIITKITQNTAVSINDIDILSKEEKDRLLVAFNDTEAAYDLDQTVLDMFMKHAQSTPDAKAILFGEEQWTYQELNTRSDQWAAYLLDSGVQPNTIVGLMMTRSVEMIVGIIAVMKAGAAYLPINPNQPTARTEYMLADCEVNMILSNVSSAMENTASYHVINTNILDNAENNHTKLPYITAADLAYVIYTSGSTGQPKGVLIQHASVSNLIQCQKQYFDIQNDERILQFAPYYFDPSVEQIWLALSSGSATVVFEEKMLLDVGAFTTMLRDQKVTHFHGTPSFLEAVNFDHLPNLKRVISGGEVCKPTLAKRIAAQHLFYNEYGPTETTVTSTVYQVTDATDVTKDKVSIGRPLANTALYILSDDLELLPEGVAGELYIGGKGLAKGYLKREDLTAKSFIANPFGDGKIYKTGDQARWLSDGTIEYLGRNDDQVKLRGYRIELGEIEFYLEESDLIDRAVVLVSGVGDHKKLIAYVCGNAPIDDAKVKSILSSKVPEYMIPSACIWMDTFALNANGKIDKKALPSPDFTEGETYVPPQNDMHTKLVAIWSKVLNISAEKISITSNFFTLGGHSLLAIKLRHLIKQDFGIELPISEIFLAPKISSLAEKIRNWESNTQKDELVVPINAIEGKEKLFMIHDGSGEIDGYLELSRNIETYSCYGIRFELFDNITEAPKITSIASAFIKEMKKVQKVGPYHLLGWSLGGEIATEMTTQLENAGEQVEQLIMIDSSLQFDKPLETSTFDMASETRFLESNFNYDMATSKSMNSLPELWSAFFNSETFKKESIERIRSLVSDEIQQLIPDFLHLNKKELFAAVNKIRLLLNASDGHCIQEAIQAKTVYIWPTESSAIYNKEKLGNFFRNFEIQEVSGNHFSVMKNSNVVSLSQVVNNQLEKKFV
ncbi:non-ribosomal peptide synthetase [Kordia sp. SMS9]|uniref:non-ribosomal peptide synthetase n=1 Tax=Kordia sp. SMS9 TaxID=2282170 RepID=UPI000E0DD134|nr:non-ribosomal peptide synthetase [Kordia sp. SMS9]